ncbi:Ppx/GppA family phosphatase [Rummeliibacillus pycnus]|uniref:Ppx/GppA phosphatase family protein n=1 Tax=Rummeliibacillus pycnus TaxID=101070 RepID=UPI0037CA32A3
MRNFKTAIIDIGSNTIRLVLYKYDLKRGMKEFENIKVVARLRNYILPNGKLSEPGILKLQNILATFQEMLHDYGINDVLATATAAIRQATNGQEILEKMKKEIGIEIKLLSEEQEAFYGYFAVVHTIATPSAVTIDMGGGSTEITYFNNKDLVESHSFPFGSVSLKQQFMKSDTLTIEERNKIYQFAKEQFLTLSWLAGLTLPVIGIGGSARNMAKMDQRKKNYPISGIHQYKMTKEDFDTIRLEIAELSFEELKQLDGLSSDRADIIAPVLEVFQALMDVVQSPIFQFSRKGLREGLVIEKILKENPTAFDKYHVLESNVDFLAQEFGKSKEHNEYFVRLCEGVYREFCKHGALQYTDADLAMMLQAAKLFYLGEYIEADAASQHTFYLLSNRSIDGLGHKERVRLALLASYKNRDDFKRYIEPFGEWFTKEELKQIQGIGALLKFAYALDASKRKIVENIEIEQNGQGIMVHIYSSGNALAEKYKVCRQKKHIDRLFPGDVTLRFIEKEG